MPDIAAELVSRVRDHAAAGQPLRIEAGGSKAFLGERMQADIPVLDLKPHQGVIAYEPKELVLRARAGTRLDELREMLSREGQMLGFEPPEFDGSATLGGTVAAGLSGPRRPWTGAVRDFVLGAGLITGTGEHLEFGGQVMKNVAGFDVSRLVCGAMGTLGIITDISVKVLPLPPVEATLMQQLDPAQAHRRMLALSNQSLPVSAVCYVGGRLYVRLSGSEAGVRVAIEKIGGEALETEVWRDLANLKLGALQTAKRLWRLSLPKTSTALLEQSCVIDWAGALRWLADPPQDPRQLLDAGHATLFRAPDEDVTSRFTPLAGMVLRLHHNLKQTFDPAGIINPGRLYRDL